MQHTNFPVQGRRPQQSGQSRENYASIRYYSQEAHKRIEPQEDFSPDDDIPDVSPVTGRKAGEGEYSGPSESGGSYPGAARQARPGIDHYSRDGRQTFGPSSVGEKGTEQDPLPDSAQKDKQGTA